MIKKEEILKIAKLSNLIIHEDEIDKLAEEMTELIKFADTINEVAEDTDAEFENINHIVNAFNDDVVLDSYDSEEILRNREGGEKGYFVVRRRA